MYFPTLLKPIFTLVTYYLIVYCIGKASEGISSERKEKETHDGEICDSCGGHAVDLRC